MLLRKPEPAEFVTQGGQYFHLNEPAVKRPQAYKDISSDGRKNLSSLFAYGKRSGELEAYRQAHMTPSGTPGVVNLGILDNNGKPQPFVPFNWNGRVIQTDANGMVKYIEKNYFQNAISLENERVKYVTQMISLVVGQPAESVIALFGYDFYVALAGWDDTPGADENAARKKNFVLGLYRTYLDHAGIEENVATRKQTVLARYASAECSPEVMCNFGDNDPEWSKAFNKLSLLIEYHPSAIIFDEGTLNPLESSGHIHGDTGHSNAGPMNAADSKAVELRAAQPKAEPARANNVQNRTAWVPPAPQPANPA